MINREPTIWESYKWYIIGGVVLILVETLLIFGLVWQRAREKRRKPSWRESEGRFRLVANTAPVMIWVAGLGHQERPDRWFGDLETVFGIPVDSYSGPGDDFAARRIRKTENAS